MGKAVKKTIGWTGWFHPEGDRTAQDKPLFFLVPLQGGFALFSVLMVKRALFTNSSQGD